MCYLFVRLSENLQFDLHTLFFTGDKYSKEYLYLYFQHTFFPTFNFSLLFALRRTRVKKPPTVLSVPKATASTHPTVGKKRTKCNRARNIRNTSACYIPQTYIQTLSLQFRRHERLRRWWRQWRQGNIKIATWDRSRASKQPSEEWKTFLFKRAHICRNCGAAYWKRKQFHGLSHLRPGLSLTTTHTRIRCIPHVWRLRKI